MNRQTLETIEAKMGAKLIFDEQTDKVDVTADGGDEAIDAVVNRIGWPASKATIIAILRERQGLTTKPAKRSLSVKDPLPFEVRRQNYVNWYSQQGTYYHPSAEQLEVMFTAAESLGEESEWVFNYAHSFDVKDLNTGRVFVVTVRGGSYRRNRFHAGGHYKLRRRSEMPIATTSQSTVPAPEIQVANFANAQRPKPEYFHWPSICLREPREFLEAHPGTTLITEAAFAFSVPVRLTSGEIIDFRRTRWSDEAEHYPVQVEPQDDDAKILQRLRDLK